MSDHYDILRSLLPAQFEELLLRLRVSPAHLSGPSAALGVRATELLRLMEQRGPTGLDELDAALQRMMGGSSPSAPAPKPAGPASVRKPTTGSLRKLLHEILRTDPEFDAFCLDRFPPVFRRFSAGLDRIAKQTLLLQCESTADILTCLRKDYAAAVERHVGLLEYD